MENQKKYPLSITAVLMSVLSVFGQIKVEDGGKVGVIVTGSGNSLNVTQIFGKSPMLTATSAFKKSKRKIKS